MYVFVYVCIYIYLFISAIPQLTFINNLLMKKVNKPHRTSCYEFDDYFYIAKTKILVFLIYI